MASRLTFEEAHRFLAEHREAVLLDVREEPEYITGHARDALLLPVDELTEESAGLVIGTKATPVLVYCRTGRRSREAARKLEEMGYTEVYDMGGLVGWPYGLE
jgi:rhodanese-related sulfurtransferase